MLRETLRLGMVVTLAALGACRPSAVDQARPLAATDPFLVLEATNAPAPASTEVPAPFVEPSSAPSIAAAVSPAPKLYACNEQPPQEFLIRGSYVVGPGIDKEEAAERRVLARKAIEYRTRHYGYVEGFGEPSWNQRTPHDYAKGAKFFGVGVKMNRRVLVALGCVEAKIIDQCADTPYEPKLLDGLRTKNTFHNDEVSNHMYGIALDIDFDKNSCCGCVSGLSEWPRCKKPVDSPFERTSLPKCWVDSFESFGFYWLGYDTLEDTMHFEFLGDPDRIVREASG